MPSARGDETAGSRTGCETMLNVNESASNNWEIDRRIGGSMMSPFCVVVLRNKKESGQSVIKASSADISSMQVIEEQMQKDLYSLNNDEFVEKYELGSCS